LIFLFFVSVYLSADDYNGHWIDLLRLLLNRNSTNNCIEEGKIRVLREAVFLTLDATTNNRRINEALQVLGDFGVGNLPESNTIVTPGGRHHQRYTHRGWDFSTYPRNYRGRNYQDIWELRKMLLINAVDKVFGFGEEGRNKRNSFAALLYYTHILGDHRSDSKATNPDRIPISGNGHDPTVLSELEKHCDILFAGKSLYDDVLKKYFIRNNMRTVPRGTTMTDDELDSLREFAKSILKELFRIIPGLLQEEEFFRRAFR